MGESEGVGACSKGNCVKKFKPLTLGYLELRKDPIRVLSFLPENENAEGTGKMKAEPSEGPKAKDRSGHLPDCEGRKDKKAMEMKASNRVAGGDPPLRCCGKKDQRGRKPSLRK